MEARKHEEHSIYRLGNDTQLEILEPTLSIDEAVSILQKEPSRPPTFTFVMLQGEVNSNEFHAKSEAVLVNPVAFQELVSVMFEASVTVENVAFLVVEARFYRFRVTKDIILIPSPLCLNPKQLLSAKPMEPQLIILNISRLKQKHEPAFACLNGVPISKPNPLSLQLYRAAFPSLYPCLVDQSQGMAFEGLKKEPSALFRRWVFFNIPEQLEGQVPGPMMSQAVFKELFCSWVEPLDGLLEAPEVHCPEARCRC